MSPEVLEMYVMIHYNLTFDWLKPTVAQICEAYNKLYGKEPADSDLESSDDEDEADAEEDNMEEGGEEGVAAPVEADA